MNFIKRIATGKQQGELTPLLEAHLDVVSGGANPGPGCAHISTGCGETHDSRTQCRQVAQ